MRDAISALEFGRVLWITDVSFGVDAAVSTAGTADIGVIVVESPHQWVTVDRCLSTVGLWITVGDRGVFGCAYRRCFT
jgi:hypothetical protein